MSAKTIKTRIQQKHDIEANWIKAVAFIPMLGEIIVYDVDETYNYERIKIGDGKTVVSALPFLVEQAHNDLDSHNIIAKSEDEITNLSAKKPSGTLISYTGESTGGSYEKDTLYMVTDNGTKKVGGETIKFTSADAGKILMVGDDGNIVVQMIPFAEEAEF